MHSLKQAIFAFWRELLYAMRSILFERSDTDPYVCYRWLMYGLSIIASLIDDLLIVGNDENVEITKKEIIRRFDCEYGGELKEHVGLKLERKRDAMKIN